MLHTPLNVITWSLENLHKPPQFRGTVGKFKPDFYEGWAISAEDPRISIDIDVYVFDVLVAKIITGIARPGVAKILGLDIRPGFCFSFENISACASHILLEKLIELPPSPLRTEEVLKFRIHQTELYIPFNKETRSEVCDISALRDILEANITASPNTGSLVPEILESDAEAELMRLEFNEVFYRRQNPDVDFSLVSPFDHFIRQGWREGRDPAPWFSLGNYATIHATNPFLHFLRWGRAQNRPLVDKSIISKVNRPLNVRKEDIILLEAGIDNKFYKSQVPHVDFRRISPAEHYEIAGWRAGFDPSQEFSTLGYLKLNPDVEQSQVNPFLHYLRQGRAENRVSRPTDRVARLVDGEAEWADYVDMKERSKESLEGSDPDPAAVQFAASLLGADLAKAVMEMRFLRLGQESERPLVSIVIPCLNEELATAECLQSISQALPSGFGIEVIVGDNGSSDGLYAAIAAHPELRYVRFDKNIGFGPICNAAAEIATGEFIFLLNNDAQIAPGCLERLVDVFRDPSKGESVGAAGPKLLFFDGHLQEAGCLLNRDGTGALTGFARDPRTPRYNYRRDVEHVSGAAVLMRRLLFDSLGGFDPIFAPAYCEDADLSLKIRQKGLRIVYEPSAVVAHHLSKTTQGLSSTDAHAAKLQRIASNRQTLTSRWSDVLTKNDLRTIAFYLPQYHPIPENDLWWGKGFTEWTNVASAQPKYLGHNQPRVPADLGYYDLRLPEVMEAQAQLAYKYGVTGFCYYYYNFDGHRLLETPLERMLQTGRPDLPYCLCWANENWTRRWDGREDDILMSQSYSDDAMVKVADDVARYFRSEAYIRIDGKPLFLVYRIKEIPNPKRITSAWRNRCRALGIGEICVAMVESFSLSARPEPPQQYGCDLTVEFPAHGMVHDAPKAVERTNFDWKGKVHDYRELVRAFTRRVEPGFLRLRSVLVGWDNTPRHATQSLVLEHATPGAFQAWLEWTYRRTMEQNVGDTRIVFINAWNEWGEGSYLEPDRCFGHAYLQAVRNALDAIETGGDAFGF